MRKTATILMVPLIAAVLVLTACSMDTDSATYRSFTFNWSDGACTSDSDCTNFDYGCGGGHTICTNDTAKWEDMLSTCEIVENHPVTQGYECGCVKEENRCGWVK